MSSVPFGKTKNIAPTHYDASHASLQAELVLQILRPKVCKTKDETIIEDRCQ